jgi:hypothetical protein
MNDELHPDILYVVESGEDLYFLRVDPVDGDDTEAVGHVFRMKAGSDEGDQPVQVLASNDTVRNLWLSPSGALWVASADGSVATTAKVKWPAPTNGAEYRAMNRSPKWTATNLPPLRSNGLPPNVTALWGTADDDVYAATLSGDVYRWDGRNWGQVVEAPEEGGPILRAIGGAPNDVYVLGTNSTILHFDGQAWQRLPIPGAPNGQEAFTALLPTPGREVMIAGTGDEGRLLFGNARGLSEFGRYPIQLLDMAPLGERILFATGDGVAELFGRDVRMIRSTFQTTHMAPGKGRMYFFEPAPDEPGFVEYDPALGDDAWGGIAF